MSSSTARPRASRWAPPRGTGVRQLRWQDLRAVRRLRRGVAAAHGRPRRLVKLLSQWRALPPQGHHAAVPGHRPGQSQLRHHRAGHDLARHRGPADDMRMFVEEAAGISRYKERRKETEARIADTRENLERLQDVRDEVDKQIRHLQRQAATARRYQVLKETERRLTAELLALRLREIDSGAEVQDSAVRECELTMERALADQRSAEAAIETQRVYQNEQVRPRQRRAGALLRSRRGDQPRRTEHPAHARVARSAAQRTGAGPRHAGRTRNPHPARSASDREFAGRNRQLGPELAQAQAAEGTLNESAGGRRGRVIRLAATLGRLQSRAGRRRSNYPGRAGAHRADRKPAATARRAIRPAGHRT